MPITGPPLDRRADLADALRPGLERAPDDVALATLGAHLSWRELDRAVDAYAGGLLGLGLRPGDRVASLVPNRTELVLHYLACLRTGFVATPLNYRYRPVEIDHALRVSGARAIVAHAERAGDLEASEIVAGLPVGVIAFEGTIGAAPRLEALAAGDPASDRPPRPAPDDPAFIFFTSGSTGPPKGVTHTHRTYGAIAASLADAMELTGEDVVMPGSSLSHIGSSKLAFAGLSVGAPLAIARSFDGHEILSLLRERRPTVAYTLPAALFTVIRDHHAQPDDFRSLRFVIAAGDKVPAELEQEFTDIVGSPIHEGYGMTEIGTSHLNPASGPNKLGSVGTANPGYRSSIRDEVGAELGAEAEGRHWVQGPSVMAGYWEDPKATAEAVVDGWLDTGDLMAADDDAYFWFRGRRKQIIVHDGSNINPEDVEEAIAAHPSVAAVGVVGIHDELHGENVWAFVGLRDDAARPTAADLITLARGAVGYKAPEVVVFLDEFPMTATGKVDRTRLKRMAAERVGAHHPD